MRTLTGADAKAMAAIHAMSFDKGWDALEMSAHCQKDICLGLGDPLSAFIICSLAADQAEILTIVTHPEERQKGLAAKTLSGVIDVLRLKGASELFLEVAEDNIAAQALYRRAGFEPIGRRPGYYRRSEGRFAALTFSKKL